MREHHIGKPVEDFRRHRVRFRVVVAVIGIAGENPLAQDFFAVPVVFDRVEKMVKGREMILKYRFSDRVEAIARVRRAANMGRTNRIPTTARVVVASRGDAVPFKERDERRRDPEPF